MSVECYSLLLSLELWPSLRESLNVTRAAVGCSSLDLPTVALASVSEC